ncbi:hypothetical protein NT04LS_2959, partial [Listeria seeligeri FSL S4-171]
MFKSIEYIPTPIIASSKLLIGPARETKTLPNRLFFSLKRFTG